MTVTFSGEPSGAFGVSSGTAAFVCAGLGPDAPEEQAVRAVRQQAVVREFRRSRAAGEEQSVFPTQRRQIGVRRKNAGNAKERAKNKIEMDRRIC